MWSRVLACKGVGMESWEISLSGLGGICVHKCSGTKCMCTFKGDTRNERIQIQRVNSYNAPINTRIRITMIELG
jgi:hypothetical protein